MALLLRATISLVAACQAAMAFTTNLAGTSVTRAALRPRTTSTKLIMKASEHGADVVSRADFMQRLVVGTAVMGTPVQESFAADAGGDPTWAVHDGPFEDSDFEGFVSSQTGLKYKDVVVGDGAQPQEKDTVRAYYCGYLLNGQIFDTSYRPALFPFSLIQASGPPTAFKLGRGGLIPGFEEALLGMKVGGKRVCRIPSNLAYGKAGGGPIPPDSPLVFYLELRSIGGGASL
jgi:hypothetical protein